MDFVSVIVPRNEVSSAIDLFGGRAGYLIRSTIKSDEWNNFNWSQVMNTELIFFDHLPSKILKDPRIISGMQSLESALVLIGFQRYPNVIALMTECIEKLLRHHYDASSDTKANLNQLIERYNEDASVTSLLKNKVNELRKFRNSLIHDAYSTKDDYKSIALAFTAALPFIDHLIRTITKGELQGIFASMDKESHAWLADIFLDTRKVVTLKLNRIEKTKGNPNKSDLRHALYFLVLASRRIALSGYNLEAITPAYNNLEVSFYMEEDSYSEAVYRFREKYFGEFIDSVFGGEGQLMEDLDCIKCSESYIVVLEDESSNLVEAGCVACQYSVSDPDLLAIFFKNKLSARDLNKLNNFETNAKDEIF